jgi:hypothetical protein
MDPRAILQADKGSLPADLSARMEAELSKTRGAVADTYRDADIQWFRDQVEGAGKALKDLEARVKGLFGPEAAMGITGGASLISYLAPVVGSYLGAKAGIGALGAIGPLGWNILGAAAIGTGTYAAYQYLTGESDEAKNTGQPNPTARRVRFQEAAKAGNAMLEPETEKLRIRQNEEMAWVREQFDRLTDALMRNTNSTDRNTESNANDARIPLPPLRFYERVRGGR